MNIALIGYGSMGQAIERIAERRGHNIVTRIKEGDELNLAGVDIVIDFASADGMLDRVQACCDAGVNMVVGTTGWYDQLEDVQRLVEGGDIAFLWSSNFSIGVNLYFKIIEAAAALINDYDEYDVWGHEIHHFNKADSPSGTAKTLSDILLQNIDRKTAVAEETLNRRREPGEIHFSSVRGGEVNFRHDIGFDSAADTIQITHSARNRDGYALGAVKAAEWLTAQSNGFYDMQNFLTF